jgi:hypothetical protein
MPIVIFVATGLTWSRDRAVVQEPRFTDCGFQIFEPQADKSLHWFENGIVRWNRDTSQTSVANLRVGSDGLSMDLAWLDEN